MLEGTSAVLCPADDSGRTVTAVPARTFSIVDPTAGVEETATVTVVAVHDQAGSPSVSLVIPVFNEEFFIRRCLLAAIHQTVPALQIIVVDNGSTDRTSDVVSALQHEFPHSGLVLLNQDAERGIVPTRSHGFSEASGDVLGRIDADSIVSPDWVEHVQQAFRITSVAAVTGPVQYYDMPLRRWGSKVDDVARRLFMKLASGRCPFLFGSNMAIRSSAWDKIKDQTCRDESDELHEDIDLSVHLSENGLKVVYLSGMRAGISARRLNDSPKRFRHYVGRFDRTYRAHQVRGYTLRIPAMALLFFYLPLKLIHALYASNHGKSAHITTEDRGTRSHTDLLSY